MPITLARWFTAPDVCNKPEDDDVREGLLEAIYAAHHVAVADSDVLVAAPRVRAFLTRFDREGVPLVGFDVVVEEVVDLPWEGGGIAPGRYAFWMNVDAVNDLERR